MKAKELIKKLKKLIKDNPEANEFDLVIYNDEYLTCMDIEETQIEEVLENLYRGRHPLKREIENSSYHREGYDNFKRRNGKTYKVILLR